MTWDGLGLGFGAWGDPPACGKEDSAISSALIVCSAQVLMEDTFDTLGLDALTDNKRTSLTCSWDMEGLYL